MSEVKKKVEAVLFSAGKRLSVEELSKLTRSKQSEVISSLEELKQEYEEKNSSLMIVNEDSSWKFSVKEMYIPVVRKVVSETELSKTILETLAVIAFKYPILQSELIKIRTNKAYDHLKELESSGYISRKKKGRTNLIMLTDKFFNYFDLPPDKLKDKFRDFEGIANAIEEKEKESEMIKQEQKKAAEEAKKQEEKIKQEIEELDQKGEDYEIPLEVYGAKKDSGVVEKEFAEEGNLVEEKEKIGDLEVIDEDQAKHREERAWKKEKHKEKKHKDENQKEETEDKAVKKEIDKMLHPEKTA